jgi:hypothetical protein
MIYLRYPWGLGLLSPGLWAFPCRPSIATSPKQQDSFENTNIHTLTQEVAKLSKTGSELVISK